ncbi:23S rRNA (uracil(1939)-C(5))-methyltransferase RlmD [Zhongshania aliphaticivorans]|uniref:23S rRNA (Uracil(1939)-C(5))-methyltransferase RlmD n=1 Tax=Zhongshania aliphaticivorans TaxID=1470434 RepID=A0A5S9NYK2_9GAMM|nr:23S rRNA (uracil(1939)-C(5))-methyltransferase RlmD [Zhongshania aliphaticivorans]CAA0089196.1 23S rRNA (uracil(1939)-C(5))-methyltransferase RlmD [Zhongshania aliphaticivorans]CAA0095877.1 23S rRNA (uracil(1939)-C(5))-methyltransferase RlmD [Zhongshania aliphaticivorans]
MAKHRVINTFKPSKKVVNKPSAKPVTLVIDRLADDARGVARHNGKVVFVEHALPTETVVAKISRTHKRFDEAVLLDVVDASPQRVSAICDIYQQCGGCQLQHLAYPAQLAHKRQRLAEALGVSACDDVISGVIESRPREYRHRARLSYSHGRLGFKARSSHDVVEVAQCPLLEDAINTALAENREAIERFFGQKANAELLFSADSTGRVGVRIQKEGYVDLSRSTQLAAELTAPTFLHSVVGSKGPEWSGENAALVYQTLGSQYLQYQPGDFTQVNTEVNRQILSRCLQWMTPQAGERIVDYFCGLGNFSLAIAETGAKVCGFDAGEQMIASAQRQAEAAGLNIEYACADLFDAAAITIPSGCEKVILDPPRAGAKTLCEQFAVTKTVKQIVYVSCDPGTLRRDLLILREGGYQLVDAVLADMFPHTRHLESAIFLNRTA